MTELRVGSREPKARPDRYVRIAKAGGSVTLTEWGKPVTPLVPVASGEDKPSLEERLGTLLREGKLVHGGGHRPRARCPQACLQGEKLLSDLIVEERDSHPRATLGTAVAAGTAVSAGPLALM